MKGQEHDTYYEVVLGPIKIKDGLFMGDELAAKDIQFIISNKVTHIINTVANNIGNLWEKFGVHYLSVGWTEYQTNVFDNNNQAVSAIFNFIEETIEKGESCLVHSINGKTRASVIIIAYLMKKYQWSLTKALQLVESRKDGLIIRPNFRKQLEELQFRLLRNNQLNNNWHKHKSEEQLLLNNTYKNSVFIHEEYYELPPQFYNRSKNKEKGVKQKKRVKWREPTLERQASEINHYTLSESDIRPILKEQENMSSKIRCYFNERDSSGRDSSKKNLSDSLDKLLFESTRRNIMYFSDEEEDNRNSNADIVHNNINQHYFKTFIEDQNKKDDNSPEQKQMSSRKTTTLHKRTTQLQEEDIQDPQALENDHMQQKSSIIGNSILKNTKEEFINKKVKHYDRVMACYRSLKNGQIFQEEQEETEVVQDRSTKNGDQYFALAQKMKMDSQILQTGNFLGEKHRKATGKVKKKIKVKGKGVDCQENQDQYQKFNKVNGTQSQISSHKVIGVAKPPFQNKNGIKVQKKRRANSAGKIKGSKNASQNKSKWGFKTSTIIQFDRMGDF